MEKDFSEKEKIDLMVAEFERLKKGKIFEREKLKEIILRNKQALFKNDFILKCIDEGTPGGIHLAGSGILIKDHQIVNWPIIKGITYHQNCGAVSLFAKENNLSLEIDRLAENFAKDISNRYKINFLGIHHLERPREFHNALGIWVCNLPNFDFSLNSYLPPGFTINPFLVKDKEYTASEINLALKIFKEHGFYLVDPKINFYLWFLNVPANDYLKFIQTDLNLEIVEINL